MSPARGLTAHMHFICSSSVSSGNSKRAAKPRCGFGRPSRQRRPDLRVTPPQLAKKFEASKRGLWRPMPGGLRAGIRFEEPTCFVHFYPSIQVYKERQK